jgi:hypothetical protein
VRFAVHVWAAGQIFSAVVIGFLILAVVIAHLLQGRRRAAPEVAPGGVEGAVGAVADDIETARGIRADEAWLPTRDDSPAEWWRKLDNLRFHQ